MLSFQRDKELSDRFFLLGPSEYNYLNQSGCTRLDGVDDEAKFDALRLAFEVVQIPAGHVDGIFSVLSAVLWLGNLTFKVRRKGREGKETTACLAVGRDKGAGRTDVTAIDKASPLSDRVNGEIKYRLYSL